MALPRGAVGLSRWLFNALSHQLPKLPPPQTVGVGAGAEPSQQLASGRLSLASPQSTRPPTASSFALPPNGDVLYWGHVKQLLVQAAELSKRARFRAERDG